MPIPPHIIQTARSRDLPPMARAASMNLKLLHPDWEFMFFDDDDVVRFVRREFPEYTEVFQTFPYKIQRFDFFRYLAIFRLGGFYFDLDVFLWENLSNLLSNRSIFPFEELTVNHHLRTHLHIDWEIGNYAFAAEPNDPFLAQVIENCVRGQRDPDWLRPMMVGIPRPFRADFEVLNSTGPGLLTRTLVESPHVGNRVTVLFPADVCDSSTWHHFGSYGIHAMEGSWRSKGNFIRRRLACLWENRTRRRHLTESRVLGAKRRMPHSCESTSSNSFQPSPTQYGARPSIL